MVGIEERTGKAYGVAEIKNEQAKDILKNGEVNFVSPSIVFNTQDEVDIHGNAIIENFEGAHVAAVAEPAYTIGKAQIKGKCSGNKETCMNNLQKVEASISPCGKYSKVRSADKRIIGKASECVQACINKKLESKEELDDQDLAICYSECDSKEAESEVTTKNKKKIIMPKKSKSSSHKLKKSKNSNNMKNLYAEEKKDEDANDEEEHVKAEDLSNKEEKRFDEEMKKGRKAQDEKEDEDAEDENKLDLTDRQEEFLKDKKESALQAEVKSLKSELRAMKAQFRRAKLEPVIDSILEAKSKLGKINVEAEYNKLIKLDSDTLESLKADYETLSASQITPRFTAKYASVDSKSGDEILKRIRGGFN